MLKRAQNSEWVWAPRTQVILKTGMTNLCLTVCSYRTKNSIHCQELFWRKMKIFNSPLGTTSREIIEGNLLLQYNVSNRTNISPRSANKATTTAATIIRGSKMITHQTNTVCAKVQGTNLQLKKDSMHHLNNDTGVGAEKGVTRRCSGTNLKLDVMKRKEVDQLQICHRNLNRQVPDFSKTTGSLRCKGRHLDPGSPWWYRLEMSSHRG